MASDLNKLREEKNIAQAAWDSMKAELDAVPREDVMVTSGNPKGECPAFIHGDFSTTKKGLIIIQEWWGVTDFMLREGREFALKGNFVTLVQDLYRGKTTEDYEEAGHMMDTLDYPGAVLDIQGAARYLRSRGCLKVGVTGFCMGGALSFAAAAKVPEISAAAPFYGIPKPELADLKTIKIPLQCHFGDLDEIANFSDPAAQKSLRQLLDSGGVAYEWCSYPKGRHAFMDYTWRKFSLSSRTLALRNLYDFMNKHLD